MRTITYKCDVCREEIKDLSTLRTIYYDSGKQKYTLIQVQKYADYDKQICIGCIEMIKTYEYENNS